MPTAAPKPCTQCGVLVRDGSTRCELHKRAGKFGDDRRGSRHARGYGREWSRIRQRIMQRDMGLCQCEECQAAGRTLAAHEVDHRIGKAEWQRRHGSLAGVDDDSNLRAINRDCHRRKTQREALAARGLSGSSSTQGGA